MRADVGDAMDDTFPEDTLMECGIDNQDYENLAELPNTTKSAAKIRGTVEKLLTLLEGNDEEDELLSCSEDEGVEADLSETEECFEDSGNLKVLYQLAVLLTEELKYPRKSSWQSSGEQQSNVDPYHAGIQRLDNQSDEQIVEENCFDKNQTNHQTSGLNRLNPKVEMKNDTCMWTAGWDACTSEAVRYLVEVEGLPVHHPTVLAMQNYLQTQRDRVLYQT